MGTGRFSPWTFISCNGLSLEKTVTVAEDSLSRGGTTQWGIPRVYVPPMSGQCYLGQNVWLGSPGTTAVYRGFWKI